MRSHGSRAFLPAAAAALVAACATSPPAPPPSTPAAAQQASALAADVPGARPARARYFPYVGAPIDHFTWMGRIDGWEALSDNELAVFVGANGAYLLTVWAPCGGRGLAWVNRVELTRSIAGTVYAQRDSISVDGFNCPIAEIRPIDYKRMKQEARARSAGQQSAAATPPQAAAPH